MKKVILALFLFSLLSTSVYANEPIPIEFHNFGGGQYIYCNNIEFIRENNLSTVENPEASYMMNNENLQPGKYSVFFCFNNWTDFSVEPDIEFKSDTGAVITIDSIGYYVPQGPEYWDCVGTWADYFGIDIRPVNNTEQYVKFKGDTGLPVTFEVKGKSEWISKYIYNYEELTPKLTFTMLVDFTIEEGEADVNFAALKHYGILRDRSMHNPDAAFGKYVRDTAVKGIDKNTLPIVVSDVEVTIDSDTPNGENLDVMVFNQSNPDGVVVPYWTTNINPTRDGSVFCRNTATASDMLKLEYKDDSKLDYYGKNVPEAERDNIWRMDIYHYDTQWYSESMPWSADDHIPNALSQADPDAYVKPQTELEFNLGNFGVTNRYNFKITNNDTVVRTLNYYIDSSRTSNIVVVRDKDGNPLNPYTLKKENPFAISKNITWDERETVCIFSAEVEPGETVYYSLDMTLPTNNYGGQLNILQADTEKRIKTVENSPFPEYDEYLSYRNIFFNGENYMEWDDNHLIEYTKNGGKRIKFPKATENLLLENSYLMEFVKTSDGYAGRYCGWDRYDGWVDKSVKNKLYLFDKDFNLTNTVEFGDHVYKLAYADGKLYVKADGFYKSENMSDFKESDFMPVTDGEVNLVYKDGKVYMLDNDKLYEIEFERDTPTELYCNSNLFWYRKSTQWYTTDVGVDNIISVSRDGLSWQDIKISDSFPELTKVYEIDKKVVIDTKYEDFSYSELPEKDAVRVVLNDKFLSFETRPEIKNNRTMVPLRFFFEKLEADVLWDEQTREITVRKGENEVILAIDSIKAVVNGEESEIDAPPYIKNNRTMVPLRFFSENLGFNVEWDLSTETVFISAEF